MRNVFPWHITGSCGFGLRGATLTAKVALYNSIGIGIYTAVITATIVLTLRAL